MADTSILTTSQYSNFSLGDATNFLQTGLQTYNTLSGAKTGSTNVTVTSQAPNPLTFSGLCGTEPPMSVWVAAWNQTTPEEKAQVQALWFKDRPFLPTSQGFLTQAFGGGAGCVVSGSFDTPLYNAVVGILRKYGGAAGGGAATTSYVSQGSDTTVASLGDELNKVLSSILNTARNVATATVTGAVAGARTASGAADAGSASAASYAGLAPFLPIILIAGGVGLVLLLRKR